MAGVLSVLKAAITTIVAAAMQPTLA